MNSRLRSLGGAALMLLLIPIFAGLLACMPVPIGDPERSRIDPDMTGIWVLIQSDESDSEPGFYVFEPYDKRTWLLTGIGLVEGEHVDLDEYDFSSYAGYEELASNEEVHEEHVYADQLVLYKAWLTKLARKPFLTWEPIGQADSLEEDPELWFVHQVGRPDEETMVLRMVDGEAEPFEDIDETRRAYERALKKHVDDPVIYGGPDDEYRTTLIRAEGPVLEFMEDVARTVLAEH